MTANLNPQPVGGQHEAITVHDRALVVEAGAGTGKTWTLVQRFLYLLERHPDWALESIAAVTFTEKAAREMRTRLRQGIELEARHAPADSPWQERRRSLERLRVGTIHSLCAQLLRENAISAGLDPRFEVLDEQQAPLLQEEAIRQALAELVQEDDPALELLAALRVRDVQEELASLLSKRGSVQRLFEQLPDSEALLARWRSELEKMRQREWRDLQRAIPGILDSIQVLQGVEIQDESDKLAPAVTAAQEGCAYYGDGDLLKAALSWLKINLAGGRQDNWGGREALAGMKEHLKAVRTGAQLLEQAGCLVEIGELDALAAESLHSWRSAWQRAVDVYDHMKAELHNLDFDDLERLAEQLLTRQPRDLRLQDTLDSLNHVMVDEFQDTNEAQQRIVYALADPSQGGRLFVVGDAKQSIYRFRQAQVTVFNRTARDIEQVTGHPPVRLDRSFRSHGSLTAAHNHLFERILQPLSGEYQDFEAPPGALEAERSSPPVHPAAPCPVELWIIPKNGEEGQRVNSEEGRVFEAQLLARRLLELHESGFPVWDKQARAYRPFQFGDAAILFRATTSLPLYEEHFKSIGLPYLTVSGRGYFDRPEVRDLIALLAALHDPWDDLNLAVALRSPLFGLSDETLYRLRWHTPQGRRSREARRLREALREPPPSEQAEQVAFAGQVLDELWASAGRIDPWRLLRKALDRTGFEAALALSDADQGGSGRQRSNVQKLLEIARQRDDETLSDFLRSLRDLTAREAREGEALGGAPESGAVNLMSIHAAKGLEFPVVVVADLGRRPGGGRSSPMILHDPAIGLVCKQRDENGDWQSPAGYVWGQKMIERMEQAENKRLLYVACTRAADLLILSGKPGEKTSWLNEIMIAWQIEPEGAETDLLEFEGFSVGIRRPRYQPFEGIPASRPFEPAIGLVEMPALVAPIPLVDSQRHYAVTRLQEALSESTGEVFELRAAVYPGSTEKSLRRAPGTLVGRLVHRLLADWRTLRLPRQELESRMASLARGEGIVQPQAVEDAVRRAGGMVDRLRATALNREIEAAVRRTQEMPFTLSTEIGQLHGVIDLLYQDRAGNWHLVEWKTDWFPDREWQAQVEAYRQQIAVYRLAAQRALGVEVEARACFLAHGCREHVYSAEELDAALEIFRELG
jgi:ATP-dependent helicase/nuclease subunit A